MLDAIVTPEGRFIDAAGHRTHIHEAGSGAPLVLLHGSGAGVSAFANWAGVMPAFAERFRVIAPDIAGFGATEPQPDARYDIKLWVRHFIGILDALGIARASVIGNSFGGALALATALSHPDRLDRLVLLGTPCGEFPMTDGLRASLDYEPSPEAMRHAMSFFPHDPAILTEELVQARYQASIRPGAMAAFRRLMPKPEGERPIVRGLPEAALRALPHKALILHGREDRVVPPDCARALNAAIADSELHVFGRCGHWVQIERRADFLRLAGDFLAAAP
jgi:2-hydroxy-6-oxo-octa-2,4-dienoate hydrolase